MGNLQSASFSISSSSFAKIWKIWIHIRKPKSRKISQAIRNNNSVYCGFELWWSWWVIRVPLLIKATIRSRWVQQEELPCWCIFEKTKWPTFLIRISHNKFLSLTSRPMNKCFYCLDRSKINKNTATGSALKLARQAGRSDANVILIPMIQKVVVSVVHSRVAELVIACEIRWVWLRHEDNECLLDTTGVFRIKSNFTLL